jgi:hypothetical protein
MMPQIFSTINNMKVVSARSRYENQHNSSPLEWKRCAFGIAVREWADRCDDGADFDVVSIGDSSHERTAVQHATRSMDNCVTKSVKLLDKPTVEQLIKEIGLLCDNIQSIVRTCTSACTRACTFFLVRRNAEHRHDGEDNGWRKALK